MPNELLKSATIRMPTNEQEWQRFVIQFVGKVTEKLSRDGDITDDMKVASRDVILKDVISRIDDSGNLSDTIQLSSRPAVLDNVLQNLDDDGNILGTIEITSRSVPIEDIVQHLADDGDIADTMKLDTRGDVLINVLQRINSVGRATDSRLINTANAANVGALIVGSNPLSGTDAGSDATVSIASFDMQYDFGTVTYNSGSITALSYSTKYYIYAEDTDYTGGAVSYLATTTDSTIVSDPDYLYVGTITTPAAAAGDTAGSGGGGYFVA